MKTRWLRMLSGILAAALLMPAASVAGATVENDIASWKGKKEILAPKFAEVSVHDPSITKVKDTYYIFGSHIEAAKSKDLMSWTRFTNGYTTPGNVLFGDLSGNLAESFDWAGENDSDSKGGFAIWAPDVFWNKDFVNADGSKGAYLMYYSASSTYIRSAIGIASSHNIEGPYSYVDTIIYSGFTADEAYDADSKVNKKWTNTNIQGLIDNGTLTGEGNWFNTNGTYKASMYPNAIDPNVFYDKDGKLWMTYGSWSGGIYILEMDAATGRPIYPGADGTTVDGRMIDRYFGTKIAGGFTKSGEGPYIAYDKKTGYYFLNVTYGWLGADGGYNMRQFRSTSPQGPYVDAKGQSAVLPGNVSNEPYGNKLIGNYLFERKVGDPGTGIGIGYVSAGHNSVYIDPDNGRQFLIFHARFPKAGEAHEVRVHQMYLNKDNWPVVAPYRYSGETLAAVSSNEVAGEYKFVNHGKLNSADIQNSVFIRLNPDHTITGDVTGTWRKSGAYYSEITIEGTVYKGVFVRNWDTTLGQYVMTFTALSDEGVSIWGSRLPDRTDREVVTDVLNGIDLGDTTGVVSNLTLPLEGTRHSTITWKTSNASVITADGVIARPDVDATAATATLTATVTKGVVTDSKEFAITVLPYQKAELKAHYAFDGDLDDKKGNFTAGTVTGNRIDNTGGTITYAAGKSETAAVFNGSSGIRLPNGLIQGSRYSVSLWLKPEQLTSFTTTFFGAKDPSNWISLLPQGPVNNNTMLWSGSAAWYDVPAGMTIKAGEWSHLAFTVENGTVKFYVNGVQKFAGTNFPNIFTTDNASFSLGVNWWDTPYKGLIDDVRIYNGVLSPTEVRGMVFDLSVKVSDIQLAFTEKKLSVGRTFTPSSVTVLPATAGDQNVVWSSANPSVAAVDAATGRVTGVAVGSTVITATAADGSGVTESYTLHVVEGPVAYYRFDDNLNDSTGFGAGTITGNRLNNTGGTITYSEGVEGQAAVFNGSSGIRLPDGLISGSTYTVAMSLYLEQENQFTTAFFGSRTGDSWISLVPRGPGDAKPTMLWSGTAWYDASTGLQIPTAQWVDIAFTVNNGTVTVYVDGVAKFTGTGFPNVFSTDNSVIGLGVNYWDIPYTGKMDELRIFDRALTAEQVQALDHPAQ